ncbi:MAG: hypothetical protein IPQ07_22865 [Myxococcales bacterium]|nr:hypothetical protein [Myxococcales bacterium]
MLAARSTGPQGLGRWLERRARVRELDRGARARRRAGLRRGSRRAAAGRGHACALAAAGGVRCVGYNANGQLGNNSTTTTQTAVDVVGL